MRKSGINRLQHNATISTLDYEFVADRTLQYREPPRLKKYIATYIDKLPETTITTILRELLPEKTISIKIIKR